MEDSEKRYFYHSFPRPNAKEDSLTKGLKILESIAKIGLVLAPEIVKWEQPSENGIPREVDILQRRISFTELRFKDLGDHAKHFGDFALEFETDELRRLGILPVFYIPNALNNDFGLSAIGASLVMQLSDCYHTMEVLEELNLAAQKDDFIILKNNNSYLRHISPYRLKSILEFINYKCSPFLLMRDTLSAYLNLFYHTDNAKNENDGRLEYYRQREWKIIPGISKSGQLFIRELTTQEKDIVINTGKDFWLKEETLRKFGMNDKKFKKIDNALVFQPFENMHIVNIIKRIFVPEPVINQAKEIFKHASLNVLIEPCPTSTL